MNHDESALLDHSRSGLAQIHDEIRLEPVKEDVVPLETTDEPAEASDDAGAAERHAPAAGAEPSASP